MTPGLARGSRFVAGGVLALALAVAGADSAKPGKRREAAGLTGQLLVATPGMDDPRFAHTVVFMVKHDAGGALGLVVNRSFGKVPVALLLDRLGLDHEGVAGSMLMRYGGPVEPGRVFVLHTTDYRGKGTQVIARGFALTTHPGVLRAIGTGAGPRRALLLLSYSGWGPGQLEREILAGAWITVPADASLVFDEDDDAKWHRALAGRTTDL
jgi:putative transcriptional regulator